MDATATHRGRPRPELAHDRELMSRYRRGDERARAALIERYLPLARHLAMRYRFTPEPLDDLVQVASLGLVKAAARWEPERGLAFSTFAVPTIVGELRRYFRDATWSVRPPRAVLELAQSIERARAPLNAAIGREPTAREIAEHFGRSHEAAAEALRAVEGRRATSLDSLVHDGSGDSATIAELIGEDDREYERAEARATLGSVTSILDDREREVLRLRFDEDLLQSEIADRIGCSQVHVGRIIRSALARLGDSLREPASTDQPLRLAA